jgi:hypothetical protein
MPDIYEQHAAAFANVSGYIILDPTNGERVATVAIKFPRDGAGRLYAYVHLIGREMVRGHANGYGYDKRSAAVSSALDLIAKADAKVPMVDVSSVGAVSRLAKASKAMASDDWTRAIEKAGFKVLQAV